MTPCDDRPASLLTEREEALYQAAFRAAAVPVSGAWTLAFVAPYVRSLTAVEAEACLLPLLRRHAARLFLPDPSSAGPAILEPGDPLFSFPAGDPRRTFGRLGEIHVRWMIQDLLAQMAAREPGVVDRYVREIVEFRYGSLLDRINRDDRAVVFVASRVDYKPMREANALKRRGFRPFLVCLDPLPPPVAAVFREAFEGIAELPFDPRMLAALVERAHPALFEVQCAMMHYHLGRVVIDHAGATRVGCAFNDITSFFLRREVMVGPWPEDQIDLDLAMERYIANRAGVVTHQWDPGIEAIWRRRFGGFGNVLEMQPYPVLEWAPGPQAKPSAEDGMLRLVWAGQVPGRLSCPPALFDSYYLGEAMERLLDQGFAVEAFQNPYFSDNFEDGNFVYYADLGHARAFRIHPGVPVDRLARELSRFDFGLILFEIDFSRSNTTVEKNTYMLTNKLFAYLEGGIPVLVNREYAAMARFVESNGFGLAISSGEIRTAGARIRSFDRVAAGERIARYVREHSMDVEIGRWLAAYGRGRTGGGDDPPGACHD